MRAALRAPALQRRCVGAGHLAAARRRAWIGGVVAGSRVKDERDVFDRARHRAASVLGVTERNDAGTTREPQRRPQTHKRIVRAGYPDRSAGVGSQRERREACGRSHAGAAARSARCPCHVVGIQRVATVRADRRETERELVEVHLAQQHRACPPQLRDLKRILFRDDAAQRERASGRWHVARVEVVLQQHRDPVQRSARSACLALRVECTRRGRGIWIEEDDGVQPRARLVVGVDALGVHPHQLLRRHLPRGHRRLQLADALLGDVE